MYKITMDLFKVNKILKVKFGLIVEADVGTKVKTKMKIMNKFTYGDNEYLKLNPHPFLTIDISKGSDKNETYDQYYYANLNKIDLFKMIQSLQKLIFLYKEIKNLFYYDINKKLTVDPKIAKEIHEIFRVMSGNRTILIEPCVVPDYENPEKFYEGCVLCIQDYAYYVYLTYYEMQYLLYELKKVNMTQLSLDLLKISDMCQEKIEIPQKTISQKSEEVNKNDSVGYTKIDTNTLPKI